MRALIYLFIKYWRKHVKSMLALLFSVVLLTIIVLNALLLFRTEFARQLYENYFNNGSFDCKYENVSAEALVRMQNDDEIFLGWEEIIAKGNAENNTFTIGSLYDPNGLDSIELEAGRMPENAGETTIARDVAKRIHWLGGIGDSIEIEINGESKIFTVVGIIAESYGTRNGSEASVVQGFKSDYSIPLIFISSEAAAEYETLYRNVMTRLKISDNELFSILKGMNNEQDFAAQTSLYEKYNKYFYGKNAP